MQGIIDFIVSLNIPLIDEGVARLIGHLVLASIIAVAAPGSLVILRSPPNHLPLTGVPRVPGTQVGIQRAWR